LPERPVTPRAEIAGVEPIAPIGDDFVERLSKAAGSGQTLDGGRGTRNAMLVVARERYTAPGQAEEFVDRILKGTTGEVRGGFGLRFPFLGRDIEGRITTAGNAATRRIVDLTPGAGRVLDSVGLRSVAEDARKVFNNYRSSKFFRAYSNIFNGANGAAYADFIRTAHTGKGSMDYATFTKLLGVNTKKTAAAAARDAAFSTFIRSSYEIVKKDKNPKEVEAAVNKYFQMADDMVLDPNASEADKLGFQVASDIRKFILGVFDGEVIEATTRAGSPIGRVSRNFLPHIFSIDELSLRAAKGQKTNAYSADKSRSLGFETDEFGVIDSRSNAELNQDFIDRGLREPGHKVFETDAFKLATPFATPILLASNFKLILLDKLAVSVFFNKLAVSPIFNLVPTIVVKLSRSTIVAFLLILLDKLVVSNVLAANCVGVT
jgi:hypothetical protein